VGPRHTVPVPGGSPSTTVLGPIDYPDSYDDASHPLKPKFIHFARDAIRDPAAPADPARLSGTAMRAPSVRGWTPAMPKRSPSPLRAPVRWSAYQPPWAPTGAGTRRGHYAEASRPMSAPQTHRIRLETSTVRLSGFVGLHVTLACAEIAVVGSPNQIGSRPGTIPGTGGTALGLPTSRRCASRRRFAIHVRSPKRGVRLTSVVVTFNGHRVRTTRGRHGRVQAIVVATSLPRGTFTVRIQARGSDGRTYRSQRHYHTCRVRGLTHTPEHLRVRGHRRPPTRH